MERPPPYLGEIINGYKIQDFVRLYKDVISFKVEHMDTKQTYLLKLVDWKTVLQEVLVMLVNEIRVLSSIDHPLFYKYIESFVEPEKMYFW